MTNQKPVVFAFDSHALRVVTDENGEPLFVGKDVCDALGYSDHTNAMKQHCRGVVKHHPIPDSLGRLQETRVLTEPDVFRLAVKSELPGAERFEAWVFEDVLPSIRKYGYYGRGLTPPQQLAAGREIRKLAQEIKRETNPALRRMLHAQFAHLCRMIGIPVPALEEIGHDALPDHESPVLEEFWEVVDMLEQSGHTLNHARDKALLALNLPQVRAAATAARLALPETAELHRLLRACLAPRFVAVKAVNSAISDATVKCWVFETKKTAWIWSQIWPASSWTRNQPTCCAQ